MKKMNGLPSNNPFNPANLFKPPSRHPTKFRRKNTSYILKKTSIEVTLNSNKLIPAIVIFVKTI